MNPRRLLPSRVSAWLRERPRWKAYARQREANALASSAKRLDLCAAQMAHLLHTSGHTGLQGNTCIEIGSGRILGYALTCHLLGAKRIIATDLSPLAAPAALRVALQGSTPYFVRDILSPFEDHHIIRQRLNRLLAVTDWSFQSLLDLGIEYRAPHDFSKAPLGVAADFMYSFSVLEHVVTSEVSPLLNCLAEDLKPGGVMMHAIHLEDHLNTATDPFAFLGSVSFSRNEESERGNRLRRSQWQKIFAQIPGLESRIFYEWQRSDAPLPAHISAAVAFSDERDLRVSHLGVCSKRNR